MVASNIKGLVPTKIYVFLASQVIEIFLMYQSVCNGNMMYPKRLLFEKVTKKLIFVVAINEKSVFLSLLQK